MRIEEFVRKDDREVLLCCNEPIMRGGKQEWLPLLKYPLLSDTGLVEHGFTTRMGGVSQGIFSSLNLSFQRGDEETCVRENYERLAQALHTSVDQFVFTHQTHTTNVKLVTKEDAGNGTLRPVPYQDVDGLITREKGLVLSTFFADCVPLFFLDPVHEAIGMSHSGWRGTVGRMGQKTLEAMKANFGTRAEDVLAAVGPSICQDCYEVSEDVALAFAEEFSEQKDQILVDKGNGKYQLDLWKCNELILKEAGVKKEHISVTNICTCCNERLLFSHRASQGKRGNLGAFIYLIEK